MASIPLIALAGRPPEQPDTLGQYARIVALKQAQQQMQYQQQMQPMQLQQQQLATQQAQMQHDSELSMMDAYSKAGGDLNQTLQLARQSGKVLPQTMMGLQQEIIGYQQSLATLDKTQLEAKHDQIEQTGRDAGALLSVPQNQRVNYLVNSGIGQRWGVDPKTADPNQLNNLLDDTHLGFLQTRSDAGLKDIKDQREAQQFAQEHGVIPPDRLQQLNAALASRYQVLNPNQSLPQQYQLPQGAKVDDFNRIDKVMEQTEKAQGTQAQRETANAFRSQAAALANLAAQEKVAQLNKPTADEQRRSDLAANMSENLDQIEDIVKRRPDLMGPISGRLTGLRATIGTSDPDIAKLGALKEYLGMASVGAHSMRNAQHVGVAADAVINGMKNSPEATLAAIQDARQSIATFNQDVQQARSGARTGITPNMVPGHTSVQAPAQTQSNVAPEGTVIQMQDGSHQVKRNGKWVPQQ